MIYLMNNLQYRMKLNENNKGLSKYLKKNYLKLTWKDATGIISAGKNFLVCAVGNPDFNRELSFNVNNWSEYLTRSTKKDGKIYTKR